MGQLTLDEIAASIDAASDSGDMVTAMESLDKLDHISDQATSEIEHAQIYFYKANCHSAICRINGSHQSWNWECPELEKEIYCLRAARSCIAGVGIAEDRSDLRFRISTNLANALNHVGRFAEAISLWDEVLAAFPNYPMSLANRGHALYWYGFYLYDTGHQGIFFNESYHQTKLALSLGVESHAVEGVANWIKHLLRLGDWENFNFQPKGESLGRSKRERAYRAWCIDHRLFLNPLNDLWHADIVANDVLTFPSVIVKLEDSHQSSPPEVYGIYNQLKQEYVSARYTLFNAIEESQKALHFSDRQVKLYDMLDYREYRLWIEKAKMAFLAAHAIFDKIAYLVNEYWSLGLPPKRIAFKSCWFKNGNAEKGLAAKFNSSENWALRGLYWISKDFAGKNDEESLLQPDAWHIAEIRNHIAHKYLKVFNHVFVDTEKWRKRSGHTWEYPISDQELITQTLKLLGLVRNALIYVSLAAHAEERKKKSALEDGILGEMQLLEIEDFYRL